VSLAQLDPQVLQGLGLMGRDSVVGGGRAVERHLRRGSPVVEIASGRQRAPTITSGTRQHRHRTTRGVAVQESVAGHPGQGPAGQFHHLNQVDSQLVRHDAVHLHHLLARDAG